MDTIRLMFYHSHLDLPSFDTPDEAKNSEYVQMPNMFPQGYAVVFELNGKYAVYVHNEDRYYSSCLPAEANALAGGWWNKGIPVMWTQIGTISTEELNLLKEHGLEHTVDEPED